MADMAYCAGNGNAKALLAKLYLELFPNRYLQTYIVGYESMHEVSTRVGEILVGPGNDVMQLRRTCCNNSVAILMQAPELQHVT